MQSVRSNGPWKASFSDESISLDTSCNSISYQFLLLVPNHPLDASRIYTTLQCTQL